MEILKIGTRGIAARELRFLCSVIKKGERITIIGIDEVYPSRGYDVISDSGVKVLECGFNCIIPDQAKAKA